MKKNEFFVRQDTEAGQEEEAVNLGGLVSIG